MLDELYFRTKQISENEQMIMCIESLNIVTSYSKEFKQLVLGISVVDYIGGPVHNCKIDVHASSPQGNDYILSEATDFNGIALFRLNDVEGGTWEFRVSEIQHQDYKMDRSLKDIGKSIINL